MNVHALLNRLDSRAHYIEGEKVFKDTDVAALFGVPLDTLKRVFKRNPSRFPSDAYVKINERDYAFTQLGVLMLSTVLKSSQAIQVNIEIIRELFAFQPN